MTTLRFRLDLAGLDARYRDLPIEVRRPDLSLIGRPLSSGQIEVEDGRYFVSAVLPASNELLTEDVIASGNEYVVTLRSASSQLMRPEVMPGRGVPHGGRSAGREPVETLEADLRTTDAAESRPKRDVRPRRPGPRFLVFEGNPLVAMEPSSEPGACLRRSARPGGQREARFDVVSPSDTFVEVVP